MFVNVFLSTNPFFDAYLQSDILGKFIFFGLILLSICTWILIIQKGLITYRAYKHSKEFYEIFDGQRGNPLSLEYEKNSKKNLNPFLDLYTVLKKHTLEILKKNHRLSLKQTSGEKQDFSPYLSPSDIDFVQAQLVISIAKHTKALEKHLFILSTIVSLAPFLGLLGTVWGILYTFSGLQSQNMGGAQEIILGGISLALATTVLGLIDAIPALIGYNYLKNFIKNFQTDMEGFSNDILASVEMQYRKA